MQKKTTIRLSCEDIEYIEKIQKENNLSSRNKALSFIINEHKSNSENTLKNMYEYMADKISEQLREDLKNVKNSISKEVTDNINPTLKSLKYSSNATNKDTQILIELMNGVYYKQDYGIVPTSVQFPTPGLKRAIDTVETKIAKEHYKKSKTID